MTSIISEAQVEAAGRAVANFHDCEGDDGFRVCDPTHCTCRKIARAALEQAHHLISENDDEPATEEVVEGWKRNFERHAKDFAESNKFLATPTTLGRADEGWVERAMRSVWENEFNHMIDTPLFRETVKAVIAAAPSPPAQSGEAVEQFNFEIFERAAEVMAIWLARFRSEDAEVTTENDRLKAGHLAGALAANNLLANHEAADRIATLTQALAEAQSKANEWKGLYTACDKSRDNLYNKFGNELAEAVKVITPFANLRITSKEERGFQIPREEDVLRARTFLERNK